MVFDRWQYQDPMLVLQAKQERAARRAGGTLREDPFGNVMRGKQVVMTKDEHEQVEALIMAWYHWSKADRPFLGFSRTAPGHELEAELDAQIDAYEARAVDRCMDTLPVALRACVGVFAANTAAGVEVFRNNRVTREEHEANLLEAKARLLPLLRGADLIQMGK